MRRFVCFSLVLFLSLGIVNTWAAPSSSKARQKGKSSSEEYDVFLLIGQSNMAGRGYMIDGDEDIIGPDVFLLNDAGEPVPATNPLNQYSSIRKELSRQQICPGLGFAKKMSKKTGRKILLVVNARGGTTIAQWAKGPTGDGFYEEAVRRTQQAMKYGTLKAILWHQGCGDSKKTDTYMGSLATFVRNLRDDLGVQVPFIAGELGRWRSHVAAFNEMLHSISEYIPQSDWVSSEGCLPRGTVDSPEPNMRDAHFCRESQILLGERYADKVLDMCYRKPSRKARTSR